MGVPYKTTPHFVAYLDLLAGKRLICEAEDESLNSLHYLLQAAIDSGAHSANAIFPKCKIKVFSDNIIIACRLTGQPERDLPRVRATLTLVSAIQIVGMEMYHYLFRGGATVGSLFIDSVMVWGSALVRATDLESGIAVYPRVVADRSLLELLAQDPDTVDVNEKYCLSVDTDGKYYLDYLSAYLRLPNSMERSAFIGENEAYFRAQLENETGVVREKLRWQTAYLKRYAQLAREASEKPSGYESQP